VNTELGVVYLVVDLDLRVVGGRAAETAYFVGHSLKWEWMLSLCCGCGGGVPYSDLLNQYSIGCRRIDSFNIGREKVSKITVLNTES
jgi:hypothetical protein